MKKLSFNMRKFKYGSASVLFTALFVALVLLVNVFAGWMTERFSLKLDLTTEGKYTLSEQTEDMLSSLSDEVTIYILSTRADMEKGTISKTNLETIQRYATASGGKVKYEFIDPNKNPKFFEKYPNARNSDPQALVIEGKYRYTVVQSSEFVYRYGSNTSNKIFYQSEELLSGAILHVSSESIASAGFVTGHNESDPSALRAIFEGNNFGTGTVDLTKSVSPDINNLVISAPLRDFTAEEILNLEEFLSRDGSNLFVLWSPSAPTLPVLERYLAEWGISFEPYIICDETNSYMSESFVLTKLEETDAADVKTQGQLISVMPSARPIKLVSGQNGYMQVTPLLSSEKTSYAKLLSADKPIKALTRENGDVSGPFTVAAITECALGNTGKEGVARVFAFGSDGFAAEEVASISRTFNSSLLTQLVGYSNENTLTMQIMPKVQTTYDLNITEGAAKLLQILLVYVMPAGIFALGIFVFIKRKNK